MMLKTPLLAGAAVGVVASLLVVEPALAGTCHTIKSTGRSSDKTKATARALNHFHQKKVHAGGSITKITPTCSKGLGIYTCKVKAVICQ